jgi:hypothetical protein
MFAYRAANLSLWLSRWTRITFLNVRFPALIVRLACRAQLPLRRAAGDLRPHSALLARVFIAIAFLALTGLLARDVRAQVALPPSQGALPPPTLAPPMGATPQFGAPPPANTPLPGTAPPEAVIPADGPPVGARRIRIMARSDVPVQVDSQPNGPNETVVAITNGVNILIDGLPNSNGALGASGSLDISADRLVLWTSGEVGTTTVQQNNTPMEIYMEGNIVFREGDRVTQAKAMYYNVNQRNGVLLDAELLSPVPHFEALVRLKAQVLKEVDQSHFVAQDASLTTSRIGIPTYEFKSGLLTLQDEQVPGVNPQTGAPTIDHDQLVSSQNNVISAEGVPVFYWPFFAADLSRPPLYIDNVAYRHDDVFGSQVLVDLNPYEILGIRHPPQGTNWNASIDYLSSRGLGGGTKFDYDRPGFFDPAGRSLGFIDLWYIDDHGIDNLGLDRRDITFPQDFRGRTLGRFQEDLPYDWQLRLELGEVTDRNFLEQYYQQEWEEQKDQVDRIGLRHTWDNMSLELSASANADPFFTQTENLPKLDHYWLGQPLLDDTFTWYEHTNVGYLRQDKLNAPTDPTDQSQFNYLPYDVEAHGLRAATRNEFDLPFQAGPVKIVPYALGEVAYWGAGQFDPTTGDVTGSLDRAYGQFGLRATMPMWSVDPTIKSELWNVNGVAHKVVFESEFFYANATGNDLGTLPIYDALDDNNIQALRRRLAFEDYPGIAPPPLTPFQVPLQFDERFYALRRDVMGWVTGPTEIAGDETEIKFDVDQRWQTKRGIPGQEHVVDWIALDTQFEIFPDPDQNFGSAAGLLDYDFHWFVGDRLTLVSYGGYDFFSDGQRYTAVGGFISRPPRGSLYLGFNDYEGGPLASDVITASYTYRMTQKWLSTFGTSFDVRNQGNIGESFRLTRVGESFLFTMGVNVDSSRGNVGFNVALIPRFLGHDPSVSRGQIDIPPAGLYGLE